MPCREWRKHREHEKQLEREFHEKGILEQRQKHRNKMQIKLHELESAERKYEASKSAGRSREICKRQFKRKAEIKAEYARMELADRQISGLLNAVQRFQNGPVKQSLFHAAKAINMTEEDSARFAKILDNSLGAMDGVDSVSDQVQELVSASEFMEAQPEMDSEAWEKEFDADFDMPRQKKEAYEREANFSELQPERDFDSKLSESELYLDAPSHLVSGVRGEHARHADRSPLLSTS